MIKKVLLPKLFLKFEIDTDGDLMSRDTHYSDVMMNAMASKITSVSIVYLKSAQAQIKENIKAPRHWPFVRGIHRWPVISPHKGPVTRKMLPLRDVIMSNGVMLSRFWKSVCSGNVCALCEKQVECWNIYGYVCTTILTITEYTTMV